jgi:hypothetical protein
MWHVAIWGAYRARTRLSGHAGETSAHVTCRDECESRKRQIWQEVKGVMEREMDTYGQSRSRSSCARKQQMKVR